MTTQMLIQQLPPEVTNGDTILRHWLVYPGGQVFFQDELLLSRKEGYDLPQSRRTEWQQLPTPPQNPTLVGFVDFGGMPMAMRSDGQAYLWGRVLGEGESPMEHWVPFMENVPMKSDLFANLEPIEKF
jgi:hypothetical protein